ncbi:unnamed protein product [Larinioides sclopetarius]
MKELKVVLVRQMEFFYREVVIAEVLRTERCVEIFGYLTLENCGLWFTLAGLNARPGVDEAPEPHSVSLPFLSPAAHRCTYARCWRFHFPKICGAIYESFEETNMYTM